MMIIKNTDNIMTYYFYQLSPDYQFYLNLRKNNIYTWLHALIASIHILNISITS